MLALWRRGSERIASAFGRKQGLARHVISSLLAAAGAFRRYTRIDFSRVDRFVFVCHGNICRSPYAEARARSLGIASTSFGIAADGAAVDPCALLAARRRGIELGRHRSRRQDQVSIGAGDLVIAMEPSQAEAVAGRFPGAQVTILGLWARPARPHLEDPFGLSDGYFATCFGVIDAAMTELMRRLAAARTALPNAEPVRAG